MEGMISQAKTILLRFKADAVLSAVIDIAYKFRDNLFKPFASVLYLLLGREGSYAVLIVIKSA